MRWLHITDIHMGRPDEAQAVALKSLVTAVLRVAADKQFDAIVITGDLANAGKPPEYERLDHELLQPLLRLPISASATVIAVPGNHDIDCESALPTTWENLGPKRQNAFFQSTAEGRQVREPRAKAFAAYASYLAKAKIRGLDPTQTISSIVNVQNTTFICLNTALFSDMSISDKNVAPAPTLALRHELQQVDHTANHIVVLGHHPLSWFAHVSLQPFRSALFEHDAIYVHGHLHQVAISSSAKGLESLGFGASYPKALDSINPLYENSFAICALDDGFHVAPYAWDAVNGAWTIARVSPEFNIKSDVLENGWRLKLPETQRRSRPVISHPRLSRAAAPCKILSLELPSRATWARLLGLAELVTDPNSLTQPPDLSPGQTDFLTDASGDRQLLRCISGQGHVMSPREVEAENTRLDTSEYDAITIVSLGSIDDDARTLALKLAQKKRLNIIPNSELTERIVRRLSRPLRHHLDSINIESTETILVVMPDGVGLLVIGGLKDNWFYVLNEHGEPLSETEDLIRRIRDSQLRLTKSDYCPPGKTLRLFSDTPVPNTHFARSEYLARCKAEFDAIKYAPLAAFGFKFPKAKLLDVYIPARAEITDDERPAESLRQAIDDMLDTLAADEELRAQLKAQLYDRFLAGANRDAGGARAFYQQHRNIVVLGDPGSGKTCFVKNEILSYCTPSETEGSWYKIHTPVFVPLTEVAPLVAEVSSLLEICARVASRRGLPLTAPILESLVANGHVAFFFDGLDEVASIEQRLRILTLLARLIDEAAPAGNRIVVTSRPAALESITVLDDVIQLQLRGLSREEQRDLARRVLAVELAASGSSVRVSDEPNAHGDESVVEHLLTDCEKTPGIGRLARNPLLLTLLVMVYANSGALSAKKHRIYAQAVQTLVSVRNREAGHQVLAESDLRRRLGELALAIYERKIDEIPSREAVLQVLSGVIAAEELDVEARQAAEIFLQLVAESTGLLVFHQSAGPEAATISFMHHSFLEYYAAVGLLARGNVHQLPHIAVERRWQEVVALTAGLIGDQADVAPLIANLMKERDDEDRVVQSRLLFAFDCALECDVPPEKTQRALIDAVARSVSEGPARVDPE